MAEFICAHGITCDAGRAFDSKQCITCWRAAVEERATRATRKAQFARVALPCKHLGPMQPGQPCGVSLHPCARFGDTTSKVRPCEGAQRCCASCDSYERPGPAWRWVGTDDLVRDAARLAGYVPRDCSGVVGVPRSGMIPASAIATHLNLPLYSLSDSGPQHLGAGSRAGGIHPGSGPLFVVDDTVYGGNAMAKARRKMGGRRAVYAAVYVRPERRDAVDAYAAELPSPHLLEWNIMNNGPFTGAAVNPVYGRGVALDLDGVIVHDEESGGPVGRPYLLPRARACRLIATGRPEAHRKQTEALLLSLGVAYERLEMIPKSSGWEEVAEFKASRFVNSGCGLYVESAPAQAERIHKLSGKPVACPIVKKVFQ